MLYYLRFSYCPSTVPYSFSIDFLRPYSKLTVPFFCFSIISPNVCFLIFVNIFTAHHFLHVFSVSSHNSIHLFSAAFRSFFLPSCHFIRKFCILCKNSCCFLNSPHCLPILDNACRNAKSLSLIVDDLTAFSWPSKDDAPRNPRISQSWHTQSHRCHQLLCTCFKYMSTCP